MDFGDPVLTSLIGGAVALVAILLLVFTRPVLNCGVCGARLPRFRLPRTGVQAALGGYTCPNCGAELDAKGQPRNTGPGSEG